MLKKVILSLLLIISFLGSISCSDNNNTESLYPYYKFSEQDKQMLTSYDYTKDKVITYQNQDGEQLHFKVISNELKKYGYYTGTFSSTGSLDYYYDSKIVRFEILENQDKFDEEQVIYVFSKSEDIFKIGIKFPIWNINSNTFIDELDRPININLIQFVNATKVQMTVNGHQFQKVVAIETNTNDVLPNNWGGDLPNNVNKVYYDFDFGIVQFNDINGNEWKVIYP